METGPGRMQSYLSNLLTTTTSKYTTLPRALLPDENDGDTEDDSHISRALRAYYTEKGRPFPQWLPPDPNKVAAPSSQYAQQYASQPARQQQQNLANARRGGGGLSDLWDSPASTSQPQLQSLRGGIRRDNSGMSVGSSMSRETSHGSMASARGSPGPGGPRPMMQQQGQESYNSMSSAMSSQTTRPGLGPATSSSSSAQDRLKAKLWAGRSNSPAQGQPR